MRPLHCVALLALAFSATGRAGEIDQLLADENLWQSDAQTIASNHTGLVFAWNSSARQFARVLGANTIFGMRTIETVMQMRDDRPVEINVLIYGRGDAGDITRDQFVAVVSNAQKAVGEWAGTRAMSVSDQLKTTGVRRDGLVWTNANTKTQLLWSYSTKAPDGRMAFRAEFVKLVVSPPGSRPAGAPAVSGPVSLTSMRSKIKRDANGDVLLENVPMVDQGEKGYCAVASAERVMRFYGMHVDQNELAQLAASSASGGTDPRAMVESLRRVGLKLGCKVKVVEEFSVQEFVRLVDRYNKAAKKARRPEIMLGYQIDISEVYHRMDTDILREIRTKSSTDVKNFLGDISKNIDQGMPLLWGVQLGKVREAELPRQVNGGHMRLITGYNPKTSEVIYSDSWGPGHEMKRMALEDAWTITCSLYLIEPRRTTL